MTDEFKQTVRLQRPSKVTIDEHGRTVWNGPVEETELELVSTQKLKQILDGDDERRRRLEAIADGKDGVLAQHVDSGAFDVIDDDDLRAALASADDDTPVEMPPETPADQAYADDGGLSLVSTMALRRMLGKDGEARLSPADDDDHPASEAGFDPYNNA